MVSYGMSALAKMRRQGDVAVRPKQMLVTTIPKKREQVCGGVHINLLFTTDDVPDHG